MLQKKKLTVEELRDIDIRRQVPLPEREKQHNSIIDFEIILFIICIIVFILSSL